MMMITENYITKIQRLQTLMVANVIGKKQEYRNYCTVKKNMSTDEITLILSGRNLISEVNEL